VKGSKDFPFQTDFQYISQGGGFNYDYGSITVCDDDDAYVVRTFMTRDNTYMLFVSQVDLMDFGMWDGNAEYFVPSTASPSFWVDACYCDGSIYIIDINLYLWRINIQAHTVTRFGTPLDTYLMGGGGAAYRPGYGISSDGTYLYVMSMRYSSPYYRWYITKLDPENNYNKEEQHQVYYRSNLNWGMGRLIYVPVSDVFYALRWEKEAGVFIYNGTREVWGIKKSN